jgi:hypothetical protein
MDVESHTHPSQSSVWADLDGKAFEAYYCNDCAKEYRAAYAAITVPRATSTAWERMPIENETMREYLRGTHSIWSRIFDGDHIFTVLANGTEPGPNDGGYLGIDAALRVKGML